ncbi:MAG TPA: carbamoyltransferase HypF [Chloroflexi bacterium]|jgi:hydrogenase maturation protein HypF|nr:carbamoyltransferase HypF [Chloroflexota bacterium]
MTPAARRVAIRGVVQGVGFRPHIYRLAHAHGVMGWVRNTSWGVEMVIEGQDDALERFMRAIRDEAPPLARIASLTSAPVAPQGIAAFTIVPSAPQADATQLVAPDVATCDACRCEVLDPADRRYRYPFTNCTHCGPRFTIIDALPYDRPSTTMRAFAMCPACRQEYEDPRNRRFHAQPNACPVCGPQVALLGADGRPLAPHDDAAGHDDTIERAAALLRAGRIVAIKGLGGYQLACDATNAAAVATLRRRKCRPDKPFAVMLADEAQVLQHTTPDAAERTLLTSPAAPIVVLPWREASDITPEVAPGNRYLGVMLPYTPLHHLLLRDARRPLVLTSGNRSEEPIARDNAEALRRLRGIADAYLTHNRDIRSRYDDSVWFVAAGGPQPVRRARGDAPSPIVLPQETRPTLACGARLKNAFCLTRGHYAFLSQHIGDLQNVEALEHFNDTLALYRRLFHIDPVVVATDLHPDDTAARYGRALARQEGWAHVAVQHHHAHLVACLADRAAGDAIAPAIGVIWDGTGYGLDGATWGGEFLIGDATGFERAAHLQYLPLPGADAAIRRPYRLAYAYLRRLLGNVPLPETPASMSAAERATLDAMVARGINTPPTSSAGRLFDAVAALLGVCHEVTYEGQAAIALEMAATPGAPGALSQDDPSARDVYPYAITAHGDVQRWGRVERPLRERLEIGLAPLVAAIVDDLARGRSRAAVATRFHRTLAALIVDICERLRAASGLQRVALSGGCFQNRLLLALTVPALRDRGFDVLTHRQVPCNDGGLALGQAVVATAVSGPLTATSADASVGVTPCA